MRSRPRVGFVLEPILGHATHARNLARFVPEAGGIDADFFCVPFAAEGAAARIPGFRSNWSVRAGLRARRAIRSMQRREPLDGLFFHSQVPAILSPDWLARIPTIVSLDATPRQIDQLGIHYEHTVGRSVTEWMKSRANRMCFARAARIVTWSEWAREGLARDYGVSQDKVSVIAPGVDLARWQRPGVAPIGDETVRLLFVGGDLERKGGTTLLEAFGRLRRETDLPPMELHLVTPAAVSPQENVVVHAGLAPNDAALIDLYHGADIFVLPTAGDCLPMVLAEAGAAGLPLVSTPVGAIPEIVHPGRSGELVPPGDVEALAATLGELVRDRDRRRRFGDGAADIVRTHHDAAANARAVVALIIDTIGPGKT